MNQRNFSEPVGIDDVQARYWNSPMSKADSQRIFDEFAAVLVKLQEQTMKLDFAVGYLLEEGNVTPEVVQAFMARKMEEFNAKLEAEKAADEAAGK